MRVHRHVLWLVLVAALGAVIAWPPPQAERPAAEVEAPAAPTPATLAQATAPVVSDLDTPPAAHQPARAVAINIGRRLGRGWRGPEFAATLAELHAAGDAAIAAASDELFQGNANDDREALLARMALIDFLGVAARANRHARERLFGFALSPLPVSDDPRLMHLDATDRLEAFVYVAALAPSVAARHVKRQPGPLFKSRYVVQFVAGREYAGATRDQAIQEAYDLFRRDGELAHLSTHNQDPETFSP